MTVGQPEPRPGHLNPALRVALYLPALFVVGSILTVASLLIWQVLSPLVGLTTRLYPLGSEAESLLPVQVAFFALSIAITWLFCRGLDRRSLANLGFQRTRGWLSELLAGFGLGAFLMALVFVIELASGSYRLLALNYVTLPQEAVLSLLGTSFIAYSAVAFNEELIARGYILQNLSAAWGRLAGLLASSAIFALAHLANPGSGLESTAGLFFAGLLLAAGYLVTRRLWLPIGLHLSWNFFQGPVFGFPVSGLASAGLLSLEPVGHQALTGGAFGPEASLVGVAAALLGLALLWLWSRRAAPAAPGAVDDQHTAEDARPTH